MKATFAGKTFLQLTREADELGTAYPAQKVVPLDYEDDADRVAICTVARIDYLVSWKFKHLTNVRREAGFNAPRRKNLLMLWLRRDAGGEKPADWCGE